ncbi:hypothetical protein [Candidatus Portiera aleyrodidarum]|uniref:hypothetical protein n=1 Tax=Candidatus Portiera aleyrodidarum TaxID=91844 RepID=UPI0021808C54|nr:hypothetical protein [Candidatus Portiera aleyrodidarum]
MRIRKFIIFCFKHIGYINPSNNKINELINQIFNANFSSSILVNFKNIEARIWKGILYITNYYKNKPENIFYSWDLYCVNKFNLNFLNLKGGEKIIKYGKIKRIKSLLQKLSITPWEYKKFIIISYKNKIVAALNNTFALVSDNWSAKIKIKYPFIKNRNYFL